MSAGRLRSDVDLGVEVFVRLVEVAVEPAAVFHNGLPVVVDALQQAHDAVFPCMRTGGLVAHIRSVHDTSDVRIEYKIGGRLRVHTQGANSIFAEQTGDGAAMVSLFVAEWKTQIYARNGALLVGFLPFENLNAEGEERAGRFDSQDSVNFLKELRFVHGILLWFV